MRLNAAQQQAIVETFLEVFGKGELRLFGSRVDDSKKGGDIDLYVQPFSSENLGEKRIAYLAKLKRKIGDQKIDLVIAKEPARPIDLIAQEQGISLCRNH
jgi:hypothetical protein